MIQISHEMPIELMKTWGYKWNDYDFALPRFYNKFPEYQLYFKGSKVNNRFIIADNGLFEGDNFSDKELIEFVINLEPNVFIIPDTWNDALDSLKKAKYWVNVLKKDLPDDTNLMAVIQCTDYNIGSTLYQQYLDLGIKHIAFNHSSEAYKTFFPHKNILISKMMGRIFFINLLLQNKVLDENVYHHLLGCSLPQEFMYYKNYNFIKSLDTSNPIILGLLGEEYKPYGLLDKPEQKIEEFMDKYIFVDKFKKVEKNVGMFRNFVK